MLMCAWPSIAVAQRCQGTTPIDRAHHGWAGGGIGFSTDTTGISGASGTRLAMLQFDLNRKQFNDREGVSETSFGGKVGAQFEPLHDGMTAVCPFVQLARGHRTDDALPSSRSSSTNIGAGVSIGAAVASSADVDVVPFLALSIVRSRVTAGDEAAVGTGSAFVLGVGFVVRNRLTVRPTITRALSGPDSRAPAFGLSAMVGFGGQR
jgi:hypothetical protein